MFRRAYDTYSREHPISIVAAPSDGTRRRLVWAGLGLRVEDSARPHDLPLGYDFSPEFQLVFPYHGAFTWQVGSVRRFIDPNVILFVRGGEEFRETHPVENVGHASAIVTLSAAVRDQMRRSWPDVTRPMPDQVRMLVHDLLFRWPSEALQQEEAILAFLLRFFSSDDDAALPPPRRVVERAKEFLHAHLNEGLSLEMVADAVGVTPIYLTQAFTRSEGVPLYRYQMRLRLARALVDLPRSDDLTNLALDLGFSSHSHFTTTFRNAFGVTPSRFRSDHRHRLHWRGESRSRSFRHPGIFE